MAKRLFSAFAPGIGGMMAGYGLCPPYRHIWEIPMGIVGLVVICLGLAAIDDRYEVRG